MEGKSYPRNHLELQKIQDGQSNPDHKEWRWGNSGFTIYYRAFIIKTILHSNKADIQMNGTKQKSQTREHVKRI